MANELHFPLFHGYVDRWLVSGVTETPVITKPTALHGAENEKLNTAPKDKPGEEQFKAERRAKATAWPAQLDTRPGGLVGGADNVTPFAVYWPFDDIGVTYAWDCETPACLSAWAYTELDAAEAGSVPFDLITCGGAALWLNGEKLTEVTPYHHNEPVPTPLTLPLQKGRNKLLVFFDNYAERDATIILRLRWKGEGAAPEQVIPVGEADAARLAEAERLMRSLAFHRNHFTAGPVLLDYDGADIAESYHLAFVGGTEENVKGGVLFRREADTLPYASQISLGDCKTFPLAFLLLQVTTEVEGIRLTRPISVEIHTESVLPRALPTVAERKRQALELLARWGEQNTNRALAILATGGDTAEAEKLLAVQSDYIRRRFDCSDFYLVYYPYILRTFGKRGSGILSEKTENELTDCLLGFRYWIDEPGNDAMWFWSENHALMFHTCQLLAGELFPDEVFTNSGLTGRQMQAKAKNMLYDWFVTFRKEGFTEWNSSPYLPIDTLGFGSLYAFAQDPAMRELGREGMDFAYYLLAVHSQQGIFASSSGRTYIKEQFGNWSNCPSGLSWIGYGYGVPGHAGKGITSYCLSDYEPPKEFAQWFSIPRGKEMICQTTQGNDGYVDLYTYKTADYMMTSANDFHPGEPGHQENPFQLTFNAVAQLWVTHPGERVLFGAARPSYWAGNGTLPKVNQYKAFAGLIYDIAPEHPVDFTHLYLPSMEFDRCEVEDKWAFVQLGSAYAAVYCSNGMRMQDFGSNKDRECIAEGRRCIWLVRAAQADEFAAFEDFKAAMRGAALDADAEGRRYRFVDPVYGELRCQWGETLYVNDAPMQYSGFDNYGKLTMQEK